MKPPVLFVVDENDRHAKFARWHDDEWDVVHAYTYEEAILALRDHPRRFDEVHLDYHLSDYSASGRPAPGEKNGLHIAEYIAAMPELERPLEVTLHTIDRHGAHAQAHVLRHAGVRVRYIRFGSNV